ncbi:MAG: hypothetical protein Q9161_004078 [Pseudevernia consocians]
MQPSDDALDFYDSLLIFHRICPFAVEHLPIMSRRVFDVGLDMGRIRNGLKHNKDAKRSKSFRSNSTKDDSFVDQTPLPNQNDALVPRHKKSNPNLTAKRQNHEHTLSNEEPVVLPSANTPAGMDSEFPLPPSKRTSPEQTQLNGNGERSLHSSQLFPSVPSNGSPENARKPERRNSSDNAQNFDLKPPPPNSKVKNVDTLSEQLFSGDHLRVILKDPSFFLRFTAFLNRYRPHSAPILVRYLEAQKAMKAVEYANAVAETMRPTPGEHSSPCPAASVDPRFEARSKRSFESLVDEALPAYITNCLTKVVTESMVREITGQGMPVMRELVGGLAEVFCLADPSIKDCPIVYASEEFYRTSRYSRDDVLGRNCRFLQGPKTNRTTVARIGAAIKSGQESCETVLNYRRDGTPFMNLLLTAPLYDNRGSVRYFIGAQIDVSGLIEDGRGLDSFAHYLAESRPNRNRDSDQSTDGISQRHLKTLSEFGQMLSLDESSVFQHHSRASSVQDNASTISYRGTQNRQEPGLRRTRRVLGNDDDEDDGKDKNAWALSSVGPSGKLPGVYQNYLLVRPHPSLRIIFVSPALRIPGLLQSPFLSRIGGPSHVREGLLDAFESGAAVTAKVTWLPHGQETNEMTNGDSRPSSRRGGPPPDQGSRARYISCTPLLGSDDQVGVWMVVMVENELVTGSLASRQAALNRYNNNEIPPTPSEYQREIHIGSDTDDGSGVRATFESQRGVFERSASGQIREERKGKVGSEGGRLYADFMKHGGGGKLSMDGMPEEIRNGNGNGIGQMDGADRYVNGEGRIEEVRSP